MHFSQRGGYGRILYLEPVHWKDDWPLIGAPVKGGTAGEPVGLWPKPNTGRSDPAERPQTSDDFSNTKELGLQWEWNHNPNDSMWSLTERPGFLKLKASFALDLIHARNTLTQQMQSESFDLTTQVDVSAMKDGQRAGLAMFGVNPSWIGVVQTGPSRLLVYGNKEGETKTRELVDRMIQLRMHVEDQHVTYSYSIDSGGSFLPAGPAYPFSFSWWKASRPALFTYNIQPNTSSGSIDVDWVHCHQLEDPKPALMVGNNGRP